MLIRSVNSKFKLCFHKFKLNLRKFKLYLYKFKLNFEFELWFDEVLSSAWVSLLYISTFVTLRFNICECVVWGKKCNFAANYHSFI